MRHLLSALALAAALAGPAVARANCAKPVSYDIKVEASRVTVCPDNFGERQCPDEGLLRKSKATGEVVRLSDCDAEKCFVDECVPPGTYQYGFVRPYTCHSSSCGTDYFQEATVTAAPGSCARTAGLAGPAAYSGKTPWGSSKDICNYGGLGCSATAAAVLPANGLALLAGLWLLRRRR